MHFIHQLSKFLLFFPLFLFSFSNLYNFKTSKFTIISQNNSYKLILENRNYLNYKEIDGFMFFLPKFTREYSIKILRFNSIGYIDGYLSMNKDFKNILDVEPIELKYYLTDFNSGYKAINYLLKGYTIPYRKVTSISIEGYNIPISVSKNFSKYVYFAINHNTDKNNKLQYLVYSVYLVLDKKKIDSYMKQYNIKNIKKFLPYLYNLKYKSKQVIKKSIKKINKKPKKEIKYRLYLGRFLDMKDYGFIYNIPKYQVNKTNLNKSVVILKNTIDFISNKIDKVNNYVSNMGMFKDYKNDIFTLTSDIGMKLDNLRYLNFNVKIKEPKCLDYKTGNKDCFKNNIYFHNYIYFLMKSNKQLDDKLILAYGDYRTYNDVAKYYFENSDIDKAILYLQKAYLLSKDSIIAHNLAVLYSREEDFKKAAKYLQQSKLEIDYYNLGLYYYMGRGVKESDKLAREYFKKAPHIKKARENLNIMKKYKIGL